MGHPVLVGYSPRWAPSPGPAPMTPRSLTLITKSGINNSSYQVFRCQRSLPIILQVRIYVQCLPLSSLDRLIGQEIWATL